MNCDSNLPIDLTISLIGITSQNGLAKTHAPQKKNKFSPVNVKQLVPAQLSLNPS